MSQDHPLPLSGVRIVDLGDPVGEAGTRLLADLGADVVKVRTTTCDSGDPISLHHIRDAVSNANKRAGGVDLAEPGGRQRLLALVASADAVVLSAALLTELPADELRALHPALVVVISSPFGSTGPRSGWQATERTLLALSGSMSRSGRPDDVPLLPPDGIADATAAAHLAWCTLVAVEQAGRTGSGQTLDLSHHESAVVGLDPAFGVQGSAAAGRSGTFRRGRPPADSYPVFPCADGYVRLCLLAKRQWRGMFGWLGEPGEFADPAYDSIIARVQAWDRLGKLIGDLFATESADALVDEAARRGVPLAKVMSLQDALASDHFNAAGTIRPVELLPGVTAQVPVGCVDIDGSRMGIRTPAATTADDLAPWQRADSSGSTSTAAPFAGLRVLDLGVIVFGAEIGRAFADLGADVIKVESLAFPDGLRQTRGGESMNASFAWGHRNRRSLGLDLRSDQGRDLFLDLVAQSDVVLSNFKPGTLAALGISYETMTERRPGIVVVESAAFSSKGPWASRLGYGPLVRAACGISSLWRYGADETECWDGVTVYPDHVAARVGALAVLACLSRRTTTGRGAHIELGQSDVVLHQLAAYVAQESLSPGSITAVGNRGRELFGGVFAGAGDDEWCVVDARDQGELDALAAVIGHTGPTDLDSLTAAVAAWIADRSPAEAMETLQEAGVPAAAMVRLPELLDDPQLAHRGTFTTLQHPQLDVELPAEDVRAPYDTLVPAPGTPAPAVGEQTREICRDVLGLATAEIEALLAAGVVHDGTPAAEPAAR